jgi:MFS family permease
MTYAVKTITSRQFELGQTNDRVGRVEEPTPTQPTTAGAWWMLTVLSLLFLFSFMDRVVVSILVEPIKVDLRATDTQMSFILGPAYTVFNAAFVIVFGWAADRFPRRWIIYAGTTLWSLATVASGLARSTTELFFARAGIGTGEASLMPSAYSMIADRFPRPVLALATAIYQTSPWIGGGIVYLLTPLIFRNAAQIQAYIPGGSHLHAWQIPMIMIGAPGFVLALLVFTFSEPVRRATVSATVPGGSGFFVFFLRRRLILIPFVVAFGAISVIAYAVQAWVPTYLHRKFGLTPTGFGPILSAGVTIAAISLFLQGTVMDRLFSRGVRDAYLRTYVVLLGIAMPAAFAIFLTQSLPVFTVCYIFIQVIFISFMGPLALTLHIITPPELRNRIVGLFLLIFSACGAAGPVIIGVATDRLHGVSNAMGIALAAMSMLLVPLAFITLCFVLKPIHNLISAERAVN